MNREYLDFRVREKNGSNEPMQATDLNDFKKDLLEFVQELPSDLKVFR